MDMLQSTEGVPAFDTGSLNSDSVLSVSEGNLSDTQTDVLSRTDGFQLETSDDVRDTLQPGETLPENRLKEGVDRLFRDISFEVAGVAEEVAHEYGTDLETVLQTTVESPLLKEPSRFKALVARVVTFLFQSRATAFAKGTNSRTVTPGEARDKISKICHQAFDSHGELLLRYARSHDLLDQAL